MAAALGNDGFGQMQYGASQPVSRPRALRIGRIQLVVGLAIIVLGLFVGRFA
jgi:hypothetical protein